MHAEPAPGRPKPVWAHWQAAGVPGFVRSQSICQSSALLLLWSSAAHTICTLAARSPCSVKPCSAQACGWAGRWARVRLQQQQQQQAGLSTQLFSPPACPAGQTVIFSCCSSVRPRLTQGPCANLSPQLHPMLLAAAGPSYHAWAAGLAEAAQPPSTQGDAPAAARVDPQTAARAWWRQGTGAGTPGFEEACAAWQQYVDLAGAHCGWCYASKWVRACKWAGRENGALHSPMRGSQALACPGQWA